jgi:hypothetical protein
MIGPHDVIEVDVCGRKALVNPLGVGAVDKTFRAVTHRAGFPAGIAPDASRGLFLKIAPSFSGRLFLKLLHIGMHFN